MVLRNAFEFGVGGDLERQAAQHDHMTPQGLEKSTRIFRSRGIRRSRTRRSKAAWHFVEKKLSHLFPFEIEQSLRFRICLSVFEVD